jgi:hypothetical protein
MIRVHGINPNSPLAHEMREERQNILDMQAFTIINGLIAKGSDWSFIEDVTSITQADWQALQKRVKALQSS